MIELSDLLSGPAEYLGFEELPALPPRPRTVIDAFPWMQNTASGYGYPEVAFVGTGWSPFAHVDYSGSGP